MIIVDFEIKNNYPEPNKIKIMLSTFCCYIKVFSDKIYSLIGESNFVVTAYLTKYPRSLKINNLESCKVSTVNMQDLILAIL